MGRGPLLMVLAMLCFAVHDALAKHANGLASIPQILALESAVVLAVISPVLMRQGWQALYRVEKPSLHVLRVALGIGELICLYAALRETALADVIALYQAAPALTVVLAVALLGERVGVAGVSGIVLGLIGALLIVQPQNATISTGHAIALLGTAMYGAFNLLTRKLRAASPATLLGWWAMGMLAVNLLLLSFFWQPVDWIVIVTVAAMGVLTGLGGLLVNTALNVAPTGVIMPLHYTMIVWAVLFGWLFWSERPDVWTLAGAVLIAGGGLLVLRGDSR